LHEKRTIDQKVNFEVMKKVKDANDLSNDLIVSFF
jgi:hypothetical protein